MGTQDDVTQRRIVTINGVHLSMHTYKYLGIGLLFLLSLVISSQVFAQGDPIEKRRLNMESNSEAASKAITKAVREGNFAEIQVKVKGIMENMDGILELFPPGSLSEKSRAKPEIWEKWDDFSKYPAKVKKAAQELGDAARAKDEVEVKAKLKALGESCESCHKSFRAPKKAQ
jgi:cytochrome c556